MTSERLPHFSADRAITFMGKSGQFVQHLRRNLRTQLLMGIVHIFSEF
jgi:hypothetical protein